MPFADPSSAAMQWFLIDGIGPFFQGYRVGKRVNWSKAPFVHLETETGLDPERVERLRADFSRFVFQAAAMGYNAITLDDLAHMLERPEYERRLNAKLRAYATLYRELMAIAKAAGMAVFVTTDFMFYTPALKRRLGRSRRRAVSWMRQAVRHLYVQYPDVRGIILRIGETDGKDVRGDFHSQLMVKTARDARDLIRALLPECESADRLLIFRIWSVGAYPIGDLQWNRTTLRRVFGPFTSDNLVLSIKYGESDFFRFLALNKQFFRTDHRKIIEVQARREYEGCGEYPSFIGWDYEGYRDGLQRARNVIGLQVWCQTGGWTRFRRLTFLDDSSIWNHINTWVAIRLFRDGMSAVSALEHYAERYLCGAQAGGLIELMTLSDQAIKGLLYVDDYARQKLFFRRVRLPSTLTVYWDRILILHPIRKLLNCFVEDPEAKIVQGEHMLTVVDRMRQVAREHNLPDDGLDFMYDTFAILAASRHFFFGHLHSHAAGRLRDQIDAYTRQYPLAYTVRFDLTPFRFRTPYLKLLLWLFLRRQRGYRRIDHVVTVRLLSIAYPLVKRLGRGMLPDFVHRQAMGLETIFR